MPIEVDTDLSGLSEELFKEIAYAVTGVAFSLHNEYGRFFAEKLYKYEIAAECRKLGLQRIEVEVPIRVTHGDFVKEYFADLLVDGSALFELKAVSGLNEEHGAQTLNYLFLMGLHRAKLINFGTASVEHEFVSTRIGSADRRRITFHRKRWNAINEESTRFHNLLIEILDDWGCFLQLPLYYEGVIHFYGGEDDVIQPIPVGRDGSQVTTQKVHLLSPETAFKITAVDEQLDNVEEHMRRFLNHTTLQAIHWVNLHRHDVTFTTLINER
jgi:GxxExxY protein